MPSNASNTKQPTTHPKEVSPLMHAVSVLKAFVATAVTAAFVTAAIPATAQTASPNAGPDAGHTQPRSSETLKKYELGRKNLAIGGYDPVAYFPEGDPDGNGSAAKGSKKITHTHRGVTYRFTSAANRDTFIENPLKYEPAYGGWCAYAASNAGFTKPSPKNFKVENGRLLLFYKGFGGDTLKAWNKEGPAQLAPRADSFWKKQTGENARVPRENGDGYTKP
ncbi:MAG: YHS domain-containing (seleno)protein [Planctomycetota bacterium]